MTLFLLTHDRRTHVTDVEAIEDEVAAAERLSAIEKTLRDHPELEIVLLTAADEADLRRTHSRYFESVDELLGV